VNIEFGSLKNQTVTCAVSGGADSVALLHMLHTKRKELNLTLYAAHYNHGLRANADADEAFVRSLCEQWNIPLTVGRGDVRAAARGMSIEEAARTLRYEFLLARKGLIATAHNADDQVETVLLNLIRGTGLRGLCGMQEKADRIVRPILTLTRQQIEQYLAEHDLPHREDETNHEDDALRNRLRHHVIPLLQKENPSLSRTVGRMTALLQADEEFLQDQTLWLLEGAAKNGGYDCEILRTSPLCHRAVRQILNTLEKPTMAHVDAVCDLMKDLRGTKQVKLPGLTVVRQYSRIYFGKEEETPPPPITVSAEEGGDARWGNWNIIWAPGLGELTIRQRQSGDVIRLPGGSKTVKKLLIDRKIPAFKRHMLPVVVRDGEIIAVADLVCRIRGLHIEERTQYD